MTMTVEAVYENGVLKLDQPLPLKDHEKVRITIESSLSLSGSPLAALAALAAEHPENPNLPSDFAQQHDHYLYGTQKHP